MATLLTRRAVVQAAMETAYNVPATLGANDGVLVMNPMYTINPNVLTRNVMRNDLSPLAHIIGRKLAQIKFSTELRGNGKQNSGLLADAPLISRLFRACGMALTAIPSADIVGTFQIGDHATEVTFDASSQAYASGTVTFAGQPANNDTVTIGSNVYTFQTVLTNVAGNVFIAATLALTLVNLKNAINGSGGVPGTDYAAATVAHPSVGATSTATTVVATASASGTAGNAIATTEAGLNSSWGSATLTGGVTMHSATQVVAYWLEVAVGGASGVATIAVTSDTAGEGSPAAVVTSGTPFAFGTKGLTLTPTFTGNLVAGQRWVVWASPTGFRLDPVSDNFESITLSLNKDGVKHLMPGSFGTFQVTAEAGNYATIEWTFTGTYVAAVDAPLPAPNFEKTLPSQVELARLRMDKFYAVVAKFNFDMAVDIQIRPDVSSSDGYIGTRIVGREPKAGIDPEADLVANQDFWGKMAAATRMPFQMRVGTVSGNQVWFLMPCTQYTGLTYADRNNILAYDAGLHVARTNGDDEVTILLV